MSDRTTRLVELLDSFLEARRAGRELTKEQLIEQNPAFAEELEECLTSIEMCEGELGSVTGDEGAGVEGVIGDFRIRGEVGRGGMAVVYEAEQLSLERRVALKVLPFAAVFDERHLQRFHNEARAAAHLHHPNIVPVHSVGSERGVHYYAMQFIDGRSVSQLVDEMRAADAGSSDALQAVAQGSSHQSTEYCRSIARLGIQAADALEYAHQRGVVHRDVKPGNLLVDASAHLWVTDFGLASFERSEKLTLTGDVVGTVRYMSPEQALAKHGLVDNRTDVYSLGATLYELLTLEPLFSGAEPHLLIASVASREPREPRRRNPKIPFDLETIVLKALEKEPGDRYATAAEFADDLRRFLSDEPLCARRASLFAKSRKWARRHRRTVFAGAGVAILLLVGLAASTLLLAREQRRTSDALARSERHLEVALQAMQRITTVASEQLAGPQLSVTRNDLLGSAREFWDAFVRDADADPRIAVQAAAAHADMAEVLRLLGDLDGSMDAYRRGLELVEGLDSDAARFRRAWLLRSIAVELRRATSDGSTPESADAMMQEALTIAQSLVREDSDDPDYLALRVAAAMGREFLGHRDAPGWSEALAWARELVAGHPGHRRGRELLAGMESNFSIATKNESVERSAGHAAAALTALRSLADEFPFDMRYRRRQWNAYSNMGAAYMWGDHWPEARDAYESAYRVARELSAQYPAIPDLRQMMVKSLQARHLETPDQTAVRARRIIDLCAPLVRDYPGDRAYARDLASGYRTWAESMYRAGNLGEAMRHLGDATTVVGDLAIAPSWTRALALHYDGQAEEAQAAFEAAILHKRSRIEAQAWEPQHKAELAYMLTACPIELLRDPTAALPLAEEAAQESPGRAHCWLCLGLSRLRTKDYRGALTALARGDRGVRVEYAYYRAIAHCGLAEFERARELVRNGDRLRERLEWKSPDLMALRAEAIQTLSAEPAADGGLK